MPSSNLKQSENSEKMEDETEEGSKGGLLGLPESDTELDVRFILFFSKSEKLKQWHLTEECNKQKNFVLLSVSIKGFF